jgi:uroporphyrinogen III methyltransferase/synthase
MGGSNVRLIAQKAITEGRNPKMPVMLVHNVSLPDQKEFFFTLEELSQSDQKFPTPVIIVIGDVVSLRNNAELAVMKPVILITGTYKGDYDRFATVVHQPLIQIEEILQNPEFENHINHLDRFDWVFFTSRYAVNFFFKALHKSGKDTRALGPLKIASVGKITSKALEQYGVTPDLQPAEESSEGLIKEVEIRNIAIGNALIPRSNLGLPILPEGLTKLGWVANTQTIYNTTFPENLQKLDLTKVQTIVFSSPSCVTNFVRLYGELPADKQFIFRGKETEKRFWEVKNSEINF